MMNNKVEEIMYNDEEFESETDQLIFVEKYRPQTIDDCILPQSVKDTFNGLLRKRIMPNLILSGSAGVGKTTVAKAMIRKLKCDFLFINGSSDLNLETLRVKITNFATSVSMNGKRKCVLVDEFDGCPTRTQDALKSFIEENSKNIFFIFTCNQANKIIAPIHSRCTTIDFKIEKADRPAMASKFLNRVCEILTIEGVTFEKKIVAQVVMQHFPDLRKTLNECQKHSANGSIDSTMLTAQVDSDVSELISTIKRKNFKEMRQWAANNEDCDFNLVYKKLFDEILDLVIDVPQAVMIISEASYRQYFCANPTINLCSCAVELMSLNWKG